MSSGVGASRPFVAPAKSLGGSARKRHDPSRCGRDARAPEAPGARRRYRQSYSILPFISVKVGGAELLLARVVAAALVAELRAGHDLFDQAAEGEAVRLEPPSHRVELLAVGEQQAAAQGVAEQLLPEVVE